MHLPSGVVVTERSFADAHTMVLLRVVFVLLVPLVVAALACGAESQPADGVPTFAGADGATLYMAACASCHGADLRGTEQGPPFLDAVYRPAHHADASFLLAVRRGARAHHWDFGNMPPVQGLTDEQVAAIVAYVRQQQRDAGIE